MDHKNTKPQTLAVMSLEKKFAVFVDFGTITVPDDYVSENELNSLDRDDFYSFDKNISYKNFPNENIKSGDKLKVLAVKHPYDEKITSDEVIQFLAKKKVIYAGPQGLSIFYKEKKNSIKGKGYRYVSFDFWLNSHGNYMMPALEASTYLNFKFELIPLKQGLVVNDLLLVFIPEE